MGKSKKKSLLYSGKFEGGVELNKDYQIGSGKRVVPERKSSIPLG